MTEKAVSALAAQKWANLVESCCPAVARTEWHVGPGEIAITAWLTPSEGTRGLHHTPEAVQIVASPETVDDYVHAPRSAQFRADAKLVDFVMTQHLHSSPERPLAVTEQWRVTSAALGLRTRHARPRPA